MKEEVYVLNCTLTLSELEKINKNVFAKLCEIKS